MRLTRRGTVVLFIVFTLFVIWVNHVLGLAYIGTDTGLTPEQYIVVPSES